MGAAHSLSVAPGAESIVACDVRDFAVAYGYHVTSLQSVRLHLPIADKRSVGAAEIDQVESVRCFDDQRVMTADQRMVYMDVAQRATANQPAIANYVV